jgi:exodeoxyribonuclease VII large subunit
VGRAAALRDVLTTLSRRLPSLPVVVYPASVQGAGAAHEIATAIAAANARMEVDVLIVCRGGGSLEDLWAFNEEAVARAIFRSRLPVVSGVGHETDLTISDFVADVRAATPTAAATLVSPDAVALRRALAFHAGRLSSAVGRPLEQRMQHLDHVARRLTHPAERLRRQAQGVADLGKRLARAWMRVEERRSVRLADAARRYRLAARRPLAQCAPLVSTKDRFLRATRARFDALETRTSRLTTALAHLNPEAVLTRGYAMVATPGGRIVAAARELAIGDDVRIRFASDEAGARITHAGEER